MFCKNVDKEYIKFLELEIRALAEEVKNLRMMQQDKEYKPRPRSRFSKMTHNGGASLYDQFAARIYGERQIINDPLQ